MTMDTEVKDPKELTVFAAFMTQTPNEELLSTGDSAAPKRRRSAEETGTGSSSSESGIYLTNPMPHRPVHPRAREKAKEREVERTRAVNCSPSREIGPVLLRSGDTAGSREVGRFRETFFISSPGTSFQNVQSHTKIHLYLRTGAHSFLPSLFSIAREWGRLFRDEPQKLSLSLRETLLVALLKEMATRAKLVMNKETARQSAVDMGWLTTEGKWAFMQWNPQTAQLSLGITRRSSATSTRWGLREKIFLFAKTLVAERSPSSSGPAELRGHREQHGSDASARPECSVAGPVLPPAHPE